MIFRRTPFMTQRQRKNLAELEHFFCHERPLRWFKLVEGKRVFAELAQLYRLQADERLCSVPFGQRPVVDDSEEVTYVAHDVPGQCNIYVSRLRQQHTFSLEELTSGH